MPKPIGGSHHKHGDHHVKHTQQKEPTTGQLPSGKKVHKHHHKEEHKEVSEKATTIAETAHKTKTEIKANHIKKKPHLKEKKISTADKKDHVTQKTHSLRGHKTAHGKAHSHHSSTQHKPLSVSHEKPTVNTSSTEEEVVPLSRSKSVLQLTKKFSEPKVEEHTTSIPKEIPEARSGAVKAHISKFERPSDDIQTTTKLSSEELGKLKERKEKSSARLGVKNPEIRLGEKVSLPKGVTVPIGKSAVDIAVDLHRHPVKSDGKPFNNDDFKNLSLTDARDAKVKEKSKLAYMKEHNITNEKDVPNNFKIDPRVMARIKEECNEEVYKEKMVDTIASGIYNPSAIAAEIKKDLGVDDTIPSKIYVKVNDREKKIETKINSLQIAKAAISDELDKFTVPKLASKFTPKSNVMHTPSEKLSQLLTHELRFHLEKDINKTMDLYLKVYPNKTFEEAFVFCRDMARNAIYQVLHDKTSFTGSDHGVLHVHHNCENGEHMHDKMDKGDISTKAKLMSRIMHFYHDIGYSVGSGMSFSVMKDHPFIGGAFIESNKAYFDHYLDPEATEIIKRSILNHAIVSFDNEKDNDYQNVRFSTSNSDACAVTADQKTQSFWRENPETLLSLAKLRQFAVIYPEHAEGRFSKLANADIMKNPEKVFPLHKPEKAKRFHSENKPLREEHFKDPIDFKAWKVYSTVRKELLDIADKQSLPREEKEAFINAIKENFNALSGEIVLGQYGAELNDVSVSKNPNYQNGVDQPKYLPAIEMAPSVLFSFLEACYSKGAAAKNINKVCQEEYGAETNDVYRALEEVASGADRIKIPSPLADISIAKAKKKDLSALDSKEKRHVEQVDKKLKNIENKLLKMQKGTIPYEYHNLMNSHLSLIQKLSQVKTKDDFDKSLDSYVIEKEKFDKILTQKLDQEISKDVLDALNKFTSALSNINDDPTTWTTKEAEFFKSSITLLRTSFTSEQEWEIMGLTK